MKISSKRMKSRHQNRFVATLDSLIPVFYWFSFLINFLLKSLEDNFLLVLLIRGVFALVLFLVIRFQRKHKVLSFLAGLYWFWEAIIFVNFEILFCGSACFSNSLFPLVRFMAISAFLFKNKSKRIIFISFMLFGINITAVNSILDPLGTLVLLIELAVFLYLFCSFSQTTEAEKKTDSLSEMLNVLPIGFIVVKKGDIHNDFTIERYNEKALNLLEVDRNSLDVPFIVSEMKTYRFSKTSSEKKDGTQDFSSWTFHEFQDFFKKTKDVSLLRLKKDFTPKKIRESSKKFPEDPNRQQKKSEENQNFSELPVNSTFNESHSRNFSHDLKLSIKHSANRSFLYIFITNIDSLEELKSQNELKTRLINSFSHELKTPLNATLPLLEFCKNEKNIETTECYLEKAICCLKLLELALNNILDYSLIITEEFILNFSRFKIKSLFYDIHEIILEKLNIKSLKFELNLPFEIELHSDYVRLKQILLNLLLNSIQFTEKGTIIVSIEVLKEKPLKLKFIVKDSGIGIAEEKLFKLRENLKFNAEIPINSTGSCLGLIISNNIANLLGGEPLSIESEVKIGTTVSFYLVDQNEEFSSGDKLEKNSYKKTLRTLKSNNHRSRADIIMEASLSFFSSKKLFEQLNDKIKNDMTLSPAKASEPKFRNFNSMKFEVKKHDYVYYNNSERVLPINNRIDYIPDTDQPLEDPSRLSLGYELETHNFENLITSPKNEVSPIVSRTHDRFQFQETFNIDRGSKTDNNSDKNLDITNVNIVIESLIQKPCKCPEVLIVDDDPFNLFSLEVLLKKLRFSCLKASNGVIAINVLQNHKYCVEDCLGIQLILMDYQMPELDGVETTSQIKGMIEKGELRNVKIVGCTAFCAKTEVFRMMDSGMIDVIFKPVNIDVLDGVLKKCVRQKTQFTIH